MKVTKSRLILAACVCLGLLLAQNYSDALLAQSSSAPGGFVESATSLTTRPLLSAAEIAGFLPARGLFTFPAPYSTQGIRLTNASDCPGNDCVLPIGYSYWKRINNHAGSDTLLAVMTLDKNRGGVGPTLFSHNKVTGVTTKVGPLFADADPLSWAHGEMFYFSATRPTAYYVHDGPRLLRYDVLARTTELVVDISAHFGADKYVWQPNSSNDDLVHSFTVRRTSDYAMLGCAVYHEATRAFSWFAATADFDECQVDKSGRFLVIKEQVDGAQGEDNLIQDLATGAQRLLVDPDGAGGHSDHGFSYMVAEDNYNQLPGAVRVWRLDLDPGDPANGKLVFQATDWNWGSNHIAHSNAIAAAPDQQMVCSSQASRIVTPRSNEVLCYKLDGSLQVLVVAPIMTNLDAAGGGDDYYKAPKGNLDVLGDYFMWTSNMGTGRMDAFIVRVPKQLLGLSGAPAPSPTPTPTPAPAPVAVSWTSLVKASATGATVKKSGGCNGCADSGALSVQEISSGDGYLEFTTANARALRYVGLGSRNPGTTGGEIRFGLRLQKGVAEVREAGVYRAQTRFQAGDALRVAVSNGVVVYAKNGTVFYTSGVAPSYPLVADTALYELKSDISDAVIGAVTMTSSPSPTPTPTPSPSPSSPATWTNLVNATLLNGVLRKTSGCGGCPDAGAVTQQQISSSGGYVEFTVDETSRLRTVGLAAPGGGVGTTLPWALRIGGGYVEVRESGVYKSDVSLAPGDMLRITVSGSQVSYSKNGGVFYTSTLSAPLPLAGYALFYDVDSTVANAMMASGG